MLNMSAPSFIFLLVAVVYLFSTMRDIHDVVSFTLGVALALAAGVIIYLIQ